MRRVGCKGNYSLSESKLHINYLEQKAVFLGQNEFQDLCENNIVLRATDNRGVDEEEGIKSALLWRIPFTKHQ